MRKKSPGTVLTYIYVHIGNIYAGGYCSAKFPDIGRNKDAFFPMSSFWSNLFYTTLANAHSEPYQISKMEIFIKIVKFIQPLAIFVKNLHLRMSGRVLNTSLSCHNSRTKQGPHGLTGTSWQQFMTSYLISKF